MALSESLTQTTKIRLNNQTYEFGMALYNPQDNGIVFPFNTAALVSLSIEEDSREWFKRGTLVVNNNENIIERRPNERSNPAANYKFRNDGRDILVINIKPIIDTEDTLDTEPFPSEGWELRYLFSVYDTEDIPGNSPADKILKMYFWELDYQLFVESTTSNWDTNRVLYDLYPNLNGRSSVLSDEQRKVPTGLALRGLIKHILDKKSDTQRFSDLWDPGSSKIFYTPPTNNNSIDDLEYLFHRHVASKTYGQIDGDVPLLYRTRYNKDWVLTSLASELSFAVDNDTSAGPLQLEQFYISSTTDTGVIIPSLPKTPQTNRSTRNLNLGYLSDINNFRFVDMAAMDNAFTLISLPCASNSIKNKTFNVDVEDTNIENVKEYFQNNYVKRFLNNKNPTALISLNKSKTQNFNYKQPYSYGSSKIDRFPDARNAILKSGFFLNQCLNFTVPGSTIRKSNVFIGLDRRTGAVDADFDEKLLGQWYVIKVVHNFTQGGYNNTFTCVKPHADRDIRIKDDVV
jgi:hypothetical protein